MARNKFAKRHYEAVAEALQEAMRTAQTLPPDRSTAVLGVYNAIADIADTFARDNGNFKRDRFERACVPGANVRARTR